MPLILQIETSSTNTSVALAKNGELIAYKEQDSSGYSHEKLLHPFIQEVLEQADVKKTDLNAVSVGTGPGSFTGLRIGVAAAKGLSYALDIPLLAVPTMELLARQVKQGCDLIVSVIDARRMEVYSSIYNTNFEALGETESKLIDEDSYTELADKKIVFVGSGATKIEAQLDLPYATYIPETLPSALEMSASALLKFQSKDWEDTAYFEPFYLKDFKPH